MDGVPQKYIEDQSRESRDVPVCIFFLKGEGSGQAQENGDDGSSKREVEGADYGIGDTAGFAQVIPPLGVSINMERVRAGAPLTTVMNIMPARVVNTSVRDMIISILNIVSSILRDLIFRKIPSS